MNKRWCGRRCWRSTGGWAREKGRKNFVEKGVGCWSEGIYPYICDMKRNREHILNEIKL